ncbi:uncharacterized protein LOC111042499 isoform X2 [Myzus persicae]|uniref:uncharacterized protein LOC111042499 isoform X2 n=1 Tax=Myzus persicae TaxID=13164 RepID=UPI000B9328A0|nr:uncharacterized protein LOC111042499 isoform X2 [Myzus persicae]
MFCPNICGHSYKGKYRKHNLKRHMMLSCRVHAQFECTFCQKRFRSNQILKTITQIRFLEKIHCLVQMVVADCTENFYPGGKGNISWWYYPSTVYPPDTL